MGRKSVAEKILERLEPIEIEDPRLGLDKIVIYDFEGRRTATEFFQTPKRLLREIKGFRVQYSVVNVKSWKGTRPVEEPAQHYGCEDIRIYANEEIE